MGWSNDQLNSIYIYDPDTGDLILSITDDGFYYVVGESTYLINEVGLIARLTADNGSYARLKPRTSSNGTILGLNPANYPPSNTPWPIDGALFAGYQTYAGPTDYQAFTSMESPGLTEAGVASVLAYARTAGGLPSTIQLGADELLGQYQQQMSQGLCDMYTGTNPINVTGTEVIVDSVTGLFYGSGIQVTRAYQASYGGTLSSTVATNRIGFRVYRCPTFNSLVGATMIDDYGDITLAANSVSQPFWIASSFNGVAADQFIVLTARRTSGAGTCNVTTRTRRLDDMSPDY